MARLLSASCGAALVGRSATSEPTLQLYLAEYQALTTRITYWITIQFSVGGAIAITLLDVLKQPAFPALTGLRVWTVVVAIEIFIGAYYYTLFEMMSHSEYIENKLAKSIRDKFPEVEDFWGYERYKKGNRVYSPSGMYLVMIFCISAPYAALLLLRPPHREVIDFVFTPLSIILAYAVFFIARSAVLTQKRFAP